MKMETPLASPYDATVRAVHVAEGDRVAAGAVLVELDEWEPRPTRASSGARSSPAPTGASTGAEDRWSPGGSCACRADRLRPAKAV